MCEQIAQLVGYEEYDKELDRKLNRIVERLEKYNVGSAVMMSLAEVYALPKAL